MVGVKILTWTAPIDVKPPFASRPVWTNQIDSLDNLEVKMCLAAEKEPALVVESGSPTNWWRHKGSGTGQCRRHRQLAVLAREASTFILSDEQEDTVSENTLPSAVVMSGVRS